LTLIGLIAFLSILRQQRHLRGYHAETRAAHSPNLSAALSQLTLAGAADTLVRRPRPVAAQKNQTATKVNIPETYRLPVRERDPDQVVIQIEPDLISKDQRNVQRLIDYLKTEMDRTHQAS
jgi:hypothetical protein